MNMLRRFEAEILFLHPNDVDPCAAVLNERGFDVEVLNWIDPCGPTVWIKARITADITEVFFFDWVRHLVGPFNGDLIEAGLANPQLAA
jgi:hypothetical protein